jgi:RNA polymerase sigma-70 factor (ECF subfamily)
VTVDQSDVSALFNQFAGQLWRALLSVAAGRADVAEEATAEAFSRLLASKVPVRDPEAWLYRTGYRVVLDQLRREQRHAPLDEVAGMTTHQHPDMSPALAAALRELKPAQRLAVFLAYHAELPISEIARLTGAPAATVKVRLHRARRALRTSLAVPEVVDG